MHRIDSRYALSQKFTEGDPAGGRKATEVSASWLNDVQENLCRVIEYANIALVKGAAGQLLAAIRWIIKDELRKISADEQAADEEPVQVLGTRAIGSVEIRVDDVNPRTLYGGVWQLFPAGYTLVNIDPGDETLDEIGKRRGSKTVKLTAAQNGKHTHNIEAFEGGSGDATNTVQGFAYYDSYSSTSSSQVSASTVSSGTGTAHENMQPSYVVKIWMRVS